MRKQVVDEKMAGGCEVKLQKLSADEIAAEGVELEMMWRQVIRKGQWGHGEYYVCMICEKKKGQTQKKGNNFIFGKAAKLHVRKKHCLFDKIRCDKCRTVISFKNKNRHATTCKGN